ncbi:hypothetical protein [Parasphingorhabdus sp.]|uniref:hypothetical protein n=1 Tax=Parasphingorhabdus sp. TaxID=2709688 RepID=UPI003BAE6E0D
MSKLYRLSGLSMALVLAIILSGCAANTIGMERAGSMTEAARVLMADVQTEARPKPIAPKSRP